MKIDTYIRQSIAQRFAGQPPTSIESLRTRGEPIKRKTSGVVIGVAAGVAAVTVAIVAGNFYNERHPQMAAMEQTPMPHSAPAAKPAPAPVDAPQSAPVAPQTAPLAGAVGGKTDDNTAAVKPLSTRKPAAKQLAPVAPSESPEAPRDADVTPMPIAPLPMTPPPSETPKE